jgi:predicted SAM-dependent methyltransferase
VSGLKINLGSGNKPLPGFVNVDALPDAPDVDVVADISERIPLDDGCAELVYASHLLEHFPHAKTLDMLREWRRLLQPGGRLMIAVPNLDVIARVLVERRGWFTPPNSPWVGVIYGGQKDQWDFHKAGFTPAWLSYLLTEAGFGSVHQVERFHDIAKGDMSHAPAPFGQNISLNMIAVAGDQPLDPELLRPAAYEQLFFKFDRLLEHALNFSTRIRSRLMARRRKRLEKAIGAG